MKCCFFEDFPKKFLHYVEKEDGTKVQIMFSESVHLQIIDLLKNNPDAKLLIKDQK